MNFDLTWKSRSQYVIWDSFDALEILALARLEGLYEYDYFHWYRPWLYVYICICSFYAMAGRPYGIIEYRDIDTVQLPSV